MIGPPPDQPYNHHERRCDMTENTYQSPEIIELGQFDEVTEYGIGGQVEGNFPFTDRPL